MWTPSVLDAAPPSCSLPNRRRRWIAIGATVALAGGAAGAARIASADSGTSSSFVAITPVRVLDTREPVNIGLDGPFVSAVSQDLRVTGTIATTNGPADVVPVGATGVSMNVTVVSPTVSGFLSIRPADAAGAPTTSSVNALAGDIVPNAVTVQVSTTGADAGLIEITFDAYGAAGPTTDVLTDIVGYYLPGGSGGSGPAGPAGPAARPEQHGSGPQRWHRRRLVRRSPPKQHQRLVDLGRQRPMCPIVTRR